MTALSLGILAALLWGIHDTILRSIGGRLDPLIMLLVTLTIGACVLAPLALFAEGWVLFSPTTLVFAAMSGFFYAIGVFGLYRAFAIGPVRLVAPISGAYPLFSLVFLVLRGGEASSSVWLGVMAVVAGVALVARAEQTDDGKIQGAAIGWSFLAAAGFALTFGFAQWAAESVGDLPVILVARVAALFAIICATVLQHKQVAGWRPFIRPLMIMGCLDAAAITIVTAASSYPHPEFAPVAAALFGIVTIGLAWRFLGEAISLWHGIGLGLAFSGLALLAFVAKN
jgi:uncharacterized membrane protein